MLASTWIDGHDTQIITNVAIRPALKPAGRHQIN